MKLNYIPPKNHNVLKSGTFCYYFLLKHSKNRPSLRRRSLQMSKDYFIRVWNLQAVASKDCLFLWQFHRGSWWHWWQWMYWNGLTLDFMGAAVSFLYWVLYPAGKYSLSKRAVRRTLNNKLQSVLWYKRLDILQYMSWKENSGPRFVTVDWKHGLF